MELQNFLSRIESLCKQRSLKRQSVYLNCGVGKDFGISIRNGSEPSIGKVLALATELDCSIDYLCGRTDNPDAHKYSHQTVTTGDVTHNSGAVGIGNTVTNTAPQLDEHLKLLIKLYGQLTPEEQIDLIHNLIGRV